MKCELKTVKQYEMAELVFKGGEPEGSAVTVDLQAFFFHGEKAVTVKGFYAGEGVYKVRFLPEETGTYPYCVTGSMLDFRQRYDAQFLAYNSTGRVLYPRRDIPSGNPGRGKGYTDR
ncbi:MAG: DUF5060 domain-containing protein [Schaedlerella sp.]